MSLGLWAIRLLVRVPAPSRRSQSRASYGGQTIDLDPCCTDLRLFLKAVLAQKPWLYDSKTIPMPWRDEIEDEVAAKIKTKKLNIGYYETDGMVSCRQNPQPGGLSMVETD